MNYQTFAPPEELKPFVKFFWTINTDVNTPVSTLHAFPDGCPGVIMVQSETALCDSKHQKLPDFYLHGQTIKPSTLSYSGKLTAIGISFQPFALKSIFGIDANELTNTGIDFASIPVSKTHNLTQQLIDEDTISGKISLLSDYLLYKHQHNHMPTEDTVKYAIARISAAKGNISLKALQQDLRLSERSLERKFNQSIGISPKLFTRICRFQESLAQLRAGSYDKLSDIAYENEYADQSYFIKAFKEFTGFSPLEFTRQTHL
jgi:AraC-like DNA-binding protein